MSDPQHRGGDSPSDPPREPDHLPSRIYLISRRARLVHEWREAFADCPNVEPIAGSYFQRSADAIVSPANSFGIMDGGLDLALREELGYSVQLKLQEAIVEKHHGELPVGSAEIVETGHAQWKYLVAAPTMRVPEPVAFTLNAYLAFRAVLVAVKNFNRRNDLSKIDSVICCGLGTGYGQISEIKCARQMRAAYTVLSKPPLIPSFQTIHEFHKSLRML